MALATRDICYEVEQFLYEEARLLEQNRLQDWLDLFSDDVRYTMPVRHARQPGSSTQPSAPTPFNLFDDDKSSLRLRVLKLETGLAPSESPATITQRLISNVTVDQQDDGALLVSSAFMIHMERLGRHTSMFIGARQDRLIRLGGNLKIQSRDILLAQTILPGTISIFL